VLRLGDVYLRVHATSKAATLGVVCLLAAAALPSGDPAVWTRCAAAAAFSIMTAPVVGHVLGLAALRSGQRPVEDDSVRANPGQGASRLPGTAPGGYDERAAGDIAARGGSPCESQ